MPELADFQPATRPTRVQQLRSQSPPLDFTGGMLALTDAMNSDTIAPWVFRQIDRAGASVEPDFKLSKETLTQLADGLPDDMIDQFSHATSMDQAWLIRQQALSVLHSRENLASLGTTGAALRIGATMLDPVAFGATVATAGLGGEAVYGAKLTMLQRLVRGGMIAGGTEAGLQGYLVSQDSQKDYKDILYAAAGGFVLGGGVNAIFGGAARQLQKAAEFEKVAEAGAQLTERGEKYFTGMETADLRTARNVVDGLGADAEAAPSALDYMNSQRIPDVTYNGVDFNLRDVSDAKGAAGVPGWSRFGTAGRVVQDPLPEVRKLGRSMVEDVLVPSDMKPVAMSASEWTRQELNVRKGWFNSHNKPLWDKYAADIPVMKRIAAFDEFNETAGRAARYADDNFTADPNVMGVVKRFREGVSELLQVAKRYRVKGFENIEESPGYVPRLWNQSAIERAIASHGPQNVTGLLAQAMMKQAPHLEIDKATKIATGVLKIIRNTQHYSDLIKSRMFKPDQAETLQRALREVGVDDQTIADALRLVERDPQTNTISRAKSRIDFDETHSITTEAGALHFTDLLENNIQRLYEVYARQIIGHSAMTEVYRSFQKGADDIIESFEGLAARMRDIAAEKQFSPDQMAKVERDLGRLEVAHREIVGLPPLGDKRWAEHARNIRAFNAMRILGQAGFMQLAETGNIIANAGLVATIRKIPMLGSIFKRAADGTLKKPLLREIESMGIGNEAIAHQIISRFDSTEEVAQLSGSRLSEWMRRGVQFTNTVNFNTPLLVAQKRWAASIAMQNWLDDALAGRRLNELRRLSMGLSEADEAAIHANMVKHSERAPGSSELIKTNYEEWEPHAASKFMVAMDKWSTRVIQSNDIGQYSTWMSTPTGKIMTQMRGYAIAAWEKQFLFNLQMRDYQAFQTMLWTSVTAGLSYVAATYLQSIGKKDRDQFLRERLSTKNIANAVYMRSSYTALFPDVTSRLGLTGSFYDTPFGNPTASFVTDAIRAGHAMGTDPFNGFTQKDGKAMARLLPWQNMIGVKNVLDATTDSLPADK